jgi:hypothetical protein
MEEITNPESGEQKEMTLQEYVDYVTLQEWKVREIKAALDMYKYDNELKALQESLTSKNK